MNYEIFSKRKRRAERAGEAEPYRYDELPEPFRNQVIHIWMDAMGAFQDANVRAPEPFSNTVWHRSAKFLSRELGLLNLTNAPNRSFAPNPGDQCLAFLQNGPVVHVLDLIEVSFRAIQEHEILLSGMPADDAIDELNRRFREHAIGYQFEGHQIVRVDSEYVHAQVIKPALQLLWDEGFEGAADEFLEAHQHYREGHNKEALVSALKSFESTLKTICDMRSWEYDPRATAQRLIEVVFERELVPRYLQAEFNALRALLESGLPTTRNREGGHGQGATRTEVPDHLAAFGLHMAASNILFMVKAATQPFS